MNVKSIQDVTALLALDTNILFGELQDHIESLIPVMPEKLDPSDWGNYFFMGEKIDPKVKEKFSKVIVLVGGQAMFSSLVCTLKRFGKLEGYCTDGSCPFITGVRGLELLPEFDLLKHVLARRNSPMGVTTAEARDQEFMFDTPNVSIMVVEVDPDMDPGPSQHGAPV